MNRKVIPIIVAVSLVLSLLLLIRSNQAEAYADPQAEFGGGFDTLTIATANTVGNEVVHYYLDGQPKELEAVWVAVTGGFTTSITSTARWESVKVNDIISVSSSSIHWEEAVSPGWMERVQMNPQLQVGGNHENTVLMTATYAYGDENVFIGGLDPGKIVTQILDWGSPISDGVFTTTVDTLGWDSFKVGFDRPQEVTITNPYWRDAGDGWVERTSLSNIFMPLVVNDPKPIVAPVGFCNGTEGWLIPEDSDPVNPQCGNGDYIVHIQGDQTTRDSFQAAVDYINGREATIWFRPEHW